MALSIQILHGDQIAPYIDDVARLRIEVFHDFPYLYDGDMAYERSYLKTFSQAKDSVLVLALHDGEVVGASTGLPLTEEPPEIQAPFIEKGYDVERVFYFSESVLQNMYRGRGIGLSFFQQREQWARDLGRFDTLTFCAVVRPEDHPLRPSVYVPLDDFWQHRGFHSTDMLCRMEWKDRDESVASEKRLRFWVKSLKNQAGLKPFISR
ncbi:MAG: GNAT family N-acetyltransferase [Saprospiraceae bacterium]|nr:GNAT family N-acetyltransferase [Saprospiraceae bacterium]